jgi:hypothetical protein
MRHLVRHTQTSSAVAVCVDVGSVCVVSPHKHSGPGLFFAFHLDKFILEDEYGEKGKYIESSSSVATHRMTPILLTSHDAHFRATGISLGVAFSPRG